MEYILLIAKKLSKTIVARAAELNTNASNPPACIETIVLLDIDVLKNFAVAPYNVDKVSQQFKIKAFMTKHLSPLTDYAKKQCVLTKYKNKIKIK